MRMALVEFGELSEEIRKHVVGCMEDEEECANFALAFVLHDHYEYEVVDCEPAFFASLIRVIDEVQGALENYRFIVRPAKSSMRGLFAPGFYGRTASGLMACCGALDGPPDSSTGHRCRLMRPYGS